ncbi:hypothetical protein BHE74_00039875 [Ensete ventricosum]|nr:hypothetical protein BHE74_00039875 [Ensete ventricosum]
MSRCRGWGFRVEWSAHLVSNVSPNLSDEESNLVGRLKGILSTSRAIMSLREEWLVEVGLSPASRALASTPTPSPRAESGSASEVQEISVEEATRRPLGEEARGAPEVPCKRQAEDPTIDRKKDWCKSHHEADRSAAKGKGLVDTAEEPPAPRRKPKSVRELCSATSGVDGRDYHAIQMCSLSKRAPDAPLDIDLTPLTHRMWVWLDGEASTRYI